MSFLPQYQQIVQGASATNSGLLQLPMMAGMLVVSTVVGQLTSRTATTAPSRYRNGRDGCRHVVADQLDLTTSSFTYEPVHPGDRAGLAS
ncbi:hypothetical protein [Kibdelosporangium philippinense]|uniref:hypothetical protein n=1 Tax=Kibdelosporangium philippinense TaxID=211113 RepID=UPI0036068003